MHSIVGAPSAQEKRKPTVTPGAAQGIADIKIGQRHRRDLGDIRALAASIDQLGLLQPIVIRPDGTLIAGERRLRAVEMLGWPEIPVNVVDLEQIVRGEFAENVHRKDFTLSEAVAIKRALEPIEREAAKERMASRPRATRSTRSPVSSASTAPPSPKPRPWSTQPRPNPRASASCSRTWIAPAASTACLSG
jgi:ParB-like nuclease domain